MANPVQPVARFHNGVNYQELQRRHYLAVALGITGCVMFVLGCVGSAIQTHSSKVPWPTWVPRVAISAGSLLPCLLCSSSIAHWERRHTIERGNNQWAIQAREQGATPRAIWLAAVNEARVIHRQAQDHEFLDMMPVLGRRLTELAQTIPPPQESTWDALMILYPSDELADLRWNGLDPVLRRRRELRLNQRLEIELAPGFNMHRLDMHRRLANLYLQGHPTQTEAWMAFLRDVANDPELREAIHWDTQWVPGVLNAMNAGHPLTEFEVFTTTLADGHWTEAAPFLRKVVLRESVRHLTNSWTRRLPADDQRIAQQIVDWTQELPVERRWDLIGQLELQRPRRFVQCITALIRATTGADHRQALRGHLDMWFRSMLALNPRNPLMPAFWQALGDGQLLAAVGQLDPALALLLQQRAVR